MGLDIVTGIFKALKKYATYGAVKALLFEVCFVNDSVDVALYRRDFDKICRAIASELANAIGKSLNPFTTSSTVEVKGARTLDINSPSLNDIVKCILNSKGQCEKIVTYAVAEGAHKSWH